MRASSGLRAAETRALAPLCDFAGAMAARDVTSATRAIARARRAGAPRVAAEEVALMLVLHAGYPAALEGARALNAAWPGRARRTREGGPAAWRARGVRLCRRVYGDAFPKLRRNVDALHPDLAAWMIEQGYGRVLSRGGLSDVARELIAVAVLAATGWERQLVSHLLGASRLGASSAQIRLALRAGARRAAAGGRVACANAWSHAFGGRVPSV
jgi:4-carboxymuconolactone decarboxylase